MVLARSDNNAMGDGMGGEGRWSGMKSATELPAPTAPPRDKRDHFYCQDTRIEFSPPGS